VGMMNHPDGVRKQSIHDDGPIVLAEAEGPDGRTVLRHRVGRLELIVNGVFAMDSGHTLTERALAELALRRLPGRPLDVVVGGLGLGYTAQRLLEDPRLHDLLIVELHPALVRWAGEGLVRPADRVLADPRVRVRTGDVRAALPELGAGSVDAVLLDVDNGPGFLVHSGNRGIYRPSFLGRAALALRPGGVLAVWSADPAPELRGALQEACGPTREVLLDVERDGRTFQYAVYLSERPG